MDANLVDKELQSTDKIRIHSAPRFRHALTTKNTKNEQTNIQIHTLFVLFRSLGFVFVSILVDFLLNVISKIPRTVAKNMETVATLKLNLMNFLNLCMVRNMKARKSE